MLVTLIWEGKNWRAEADEDGNQPTELRRVYVDPEQVCAIVPADAEEGCSLLFRNTSYHEDGLWVGLSAESVARVINTALELLDGFELHNYEKKFVQTSQSELAEELAKKL